MTSGKTIIPLPKNPLIHECKAMVSNSIADRSSIRMNKTKILILKTIQISLRPLVMT